MEYSPHVNDVRIARWLCAYEWIFGVCPRGRFYRTFLGCILIGIDDEHEAELLWLRFRRL